MCEPLRGKGLKYGSISNSCPWNFFSEIDVKSAVEFYKKYRYNEYEVKANYYNIYDVFDTSGRGEQSWTDWLFDYCFGDVVDD